SLQATTLIGHGVMVPGTTILAGKGAEEGAVTSTTPFGVELQHNADAAAKLQYLHVTNGGMMAFYDDGNAKMCARCEPMVQNLKS
ncbi:hypothetical protein MJN51_33665, partial [Salmonella enterica subsp. enterica serovar Kentucky]|nr:hypothetical protein [Salmonella enterica subsp. enterica serovar Kentucky]